MTLPRPLATLLDLQGSVDVAQYMACCLGGAGSGYYERPETIGAAGDFVTAPEISQCFGELLGAALVDYWQQTGRPSCVALAELGPGKGTLLEDVLRACRVAPDFLRALREVHLVESSERLRETQRRRLAGMPLRFHRDPGTLPRRIPLYLLANEFFDALPIRQYVWTARGLRERRIARDDQGKLGFVLDPRALPVPISRDLDSPPPEGAVIELSPAREAAIREVAQRIAEAGGIAYVIDYGTDRAPLGDTLQAVHGHRKVDPLTMPGEADLSSHVDFRALAAAARASGARAFGPVAQGEFLRRLGIEARLEVLAAAAPGKARQLRLGVERLVAPEAMGQLFRVLAVTAGGSPVPPGFLEDEELR